MLDVLYCTCRDSDKLRRASHILISIPPKPNEPSSSQLAEDVVCARSPSIMSDESMPCRLDIRVLS